MTTRAGKSDERRATLQDREHMMQDALDRIRHTGTAAALKTCSGLVERINAKLGKIHVEDCRDPSEVNELQVFLERAAAVLKKL